VNNITRVFLVGGGPGDPELISLKAVRAIQSADVILYDYLVHPSIVMMSESAELICVGKKKGAHSAKQEDINQRMVDLALAGKIVVRLKGGDPMIFGRSGEEVATLIEHNILFEIIPGITSAIAAPMYAGIPLTHRAMSHSVAFVTATRMNDIQNDAFPNADTLVIMMSLLRLSHIVTRLIELRGPDTPISIIQSGTYAKQRVITGTLATINAIQSVEGLVPPALLVVGSVVNKQWDWRSHLPLRHQRFVITRAGHQQSGLQRPLQQLGAEVFTLPLNRIMYRTTCLNGVDIASVTQVVFSSENGVVAFFKSMAKLGVDIRAFHQAKIRAVGHKTAQLLSQYGLCVQSIPGVTTMASMRVFLKGQLTANDHVLVPTSSEAVPVLNDLAQQGIRVTYITAYENQCPLPPVSPQWIYDSDTFIFMNAASVRRCHQWYSRIAHHNVVSIGPQTTVALRDIGVTSIIEAQVPSIDAIITAILTSKTG
jgi:uroporphyrinogen III methyltransferase/synthase